MKKLFFILLAVVILHPLDAKRYRKNSLKRNDVEAPLQTVSSQPIIRRVPATRPSISLNNITVPTDERILYQPIQFNKHHLNAFFTKAFSSPQYRRDILPYNLHHMTQLIEHGIHRTQGKSYTQSIIRLFHNALKSSMYLNADAFSTSIEQITPLLSSIFTPILADTTQSMKKHISDLLYTQLIDSFTQFKEDPDAIINDISEEIACHTADPTTLFGDISIHELRKTVMTFLEQSLSKLIWNPKTSTKSWESVKHIAQQLQAMQTENIIADEEDLNDLYITLVERYCLFMDLNTPYLEIPFYETVRKEVTTDQLPFLCLAEQEPFLEKKYERILRALMECEAKTRAQEYGIIIS